MHQLIADANNGIQEMLEGAAHVKGDAFLLVAAGMLMQHQQIWMAETLLGLAAEDHAETAAEMAEMVRTQADQTMAILVRLLNDAGDETEVRKLALQMINRQRGAAKKFEASQG